MRTTISRGILAVIAAFAVGCGTADSVSPTTMSAATRRTVVADAAGPNTTRTIDQYIWVSCTNGGVGETIRVAGELRYDVQSSKDSSGVYHLSIKSNTSNLTGVGQTTGAFFRGVMTERVNSRAEDYLNMDVRTADIIRFVAPGSGDSYSLIVTSHFIVDEGTYVLWDQTWNEVCR
jgi:hypothetical protein